MNISVISNKCSGRNANINLSSGGKIILPKTNGVWEDKSKRGECTWYPGLPDDANPETKPSKSNPEGLTWKEIKEKYGFEGIVFKNKEPNFRPLSRGHVVFAEGQYSSNRRKNFKVADMKMAEQLNDKYRRKYGKDRDPLYTRTDVKKWRKENGYTWHEERNCVDIQKIPSIINNNVPHSGGIAAKSALEKQSCDI